MIAEIALGLAVLLQQLLHFKQIQGMREEIRLAHNREYAHSISELATLQHITKPSKSDIAQAIRNGKTPPPSEEKSPSLPYGL